MPEQTTPAADCVAQLKVLAEETRLAVMKLLMHGPQHVGEFNGVLDMDQSLLSHHLRVLREAGLVEAGARGLCHWQEPRHRAGLLPALP